VTGTFSQVIAVAAFFFVLQYVVSFSALFVLRRREPDQPRPYRAWGYPVTTAISWLGSGVPDWRGRAGSAEQCDCDRDSGCELSSVSGPSVAAGGLAGTS
jgi:hypothetical protein